MGKQIVHCGGAGAGQAAKICNNMILGVSMIAVSEAFALGLEVRHDRIRRCSMNLASSPPRLKSPRRRHPLIARCRARRRHRPPDNARQEDLGSASAPMVKDMTLAQDAAKASGAATPSGKQAQEIYKAFDPPVTVGWNSRDYPARPEIGRQIKLEPMTTFQEARAFSSSIGRTTTKPSKNSAGPTRCRSTGRWTGSMRNWHAIRTAGIVPALWIVDAGGHHETELSFDALSRRSNQVANFLQAQGLKRGDRLLLLLGNVRSVVGDHAGGDQARGDDDTRDHVADGGRIARPARSRPRRDGGGVAGPGREIRRSRPLTARAHRRQPVDARGGLGDLRGSADFPESFTPDGPTQPEDPMLLYFASGTTAKPNSCGTASAVIPSAGCRPCTGSGCCPATST